MNISFFDSFERKLALLLSLIIAAISVFIFLYFPYYFEEEQTKAIKNKVKELTEMTAFSIGAGMVFDDLDAVTEGVKPLLRDKNILYLVIHSSNNNVPYYYYKFNSAKQLKYNGFENAEEYDVVKDVYKVKYDINFNNVNAGKIYLGYSFNELYDNIADIKSTIFYVSFFVFVIGVFSATIMGKFLTIPLLKVAETANRISAGDFSVRAPVLSKDEIGLLANSFNQMTGKILNANHQLELINSELEKRVDDRTYELKKSKEKAEASDKMKCLFLSQISHEIRTPVSTVLNYVSLIKQEFLEEGEFQKHPQSMQYFDSIEIGSHRLIRTIESILNMSQLLAGNFDVKFSTYDFLNDILNPLLVDSKRRAEMKGLAFQTDMPSHQLKVYGDHYSITQIFMHLIDNAINFTNKGFIKISVIDVDEFNFYAAIEDSGIGMSEEFRQKIFEPFTQEETGYTRKFDGTGLGLALVNNYCKLNCIKIFLESEKSRGTKFSLLLNKNANAQPH